MVLEQCLTEIVLVPDTVQIPGEVIPKGLTTTLFDYTVAALPLWAFVEAALVVVVLAAIFYWLTRRNSLSDVMGFKDMGTAIKTGDAFLSWRIGQDLKLRIQCLNYIGGALTYEDIDPRNPSIWIHSGPKATYAIGGVNGVFLSENFGKSRDIGAETALITIIQAHNESFKADPNSQIQSYEDFESFGRRYLKSVFMEHIPAPCYRQVNPSLIQQFLPRNFTPTFAGSVIREEAKKLNSAEDPEGFFTKFMPIMAVVAIVMIALIIAWAIPM